MYVHTIHNIIQIHNLANLLHKINKKEIILIDRKRKQAEKNMMKLLN